MLAGGCARVVDPFLIPPRFPERSARLMEAARGIEAEWGGRYRHLAWRHDGIEHHAVLLVPEGRPVGAAVIIHGLGDQKESMLWYAQYYARHGYLCAVPDLRAHGQSGGTYTTFGARERGDLSAMLDVLASQGYDVSRVGVLGGSLGAATAIQWSGAEPRIKAIVAIAPFAELRAVAEDLHARRGLSRTKVFVLESMAEWAGRFRIAEASALAALSASDTPLYLVRGDQDEMIPPAQSDRLFAAARGPVVLQRVSGAGHFDILDRVGKDFDRRTLNWLNAFVPEHGGAPLGAWAGELAHRNLPAGRLGPATAQAGGSGMQ